MEAAQSNQYSTTGAKQRGSGGTLALDCPVCLGILPLGRIIDSLHLVNWDLHAQGENCEWSSTRTLCCGVL